MPGIYVNPVAIKYGQHIAKRSLRTTLNIFLSVVLELHLTMRLPKAIQTPDPVDFLGYLK